MREPELTIGMPVHNGEVTIRAALDSLLAQTFQNFTLIISDNNSSDGTEQICREYESRDPRIRYVRHTRNLGPASNFRFVLVEAVAPFFMWAAADDLWTSNFIERTLHFLALNSDYVCCQSRVLFVTKQGESYFATGTYALTGTWRDNVERFIRNPADNSRYYGVFRTEALRSVFPARSFYAHDWAVSVGTLKFGKHAELAECLMIRDASPLAAYARALRSDNWFVLWRLFPLLRMTIHCLRKGYVPWTVAAFDALLRLNLYITCLLGIFDFGPIGRRYIQTHSLSYAVLGRYSRLRLPWYQRLRSSWLARDLPTNTPTLPPRLARSKWVSMAPLAGRSPDITILLVTKSLENTLAFIDSLARSLDRLLALDLIICDVGEGDVTGMLFANHPSVQYVRCAPDAGYSIAANRGLPSIHATIVGFFEAETLIESGAIQQLLSGLTDQNGIVGPQVLYSDGRLKAAGGIVNHRKVVYGYGRLDSNAEHPRYKFARKVDFCPTGYLIRRDIIHRLSGFSEKYSTFEFAHIDIAFRARALGYSCHYCPSARVTSYCVEGSAESQSDFDRFVRDNSALIADDYEAIGRDLSRLHDRAPAARVLYIDADTPTPDQNAGSIYAINIIRVLNECGFRVTFVPESNFMHRGKYTDRLQAMGVEAIYGPYFLSIRDLLFEKAGNFELVVLCRVEIAHRYFDLARKLVPTARIVFNTVDLHFLREMRGAELSGQAEAIESARRTRDLEIASIRKADATIVLSDHEAEIVRREVPSARIHVIPLVPDPCELLHAAPVIVPFAARSGVIFVGTYQHQPNADAVAYFVKEVWPLVWERLPTAVFRIVGSEVTPEVMALAGNGVEVIGFVDDLHAVLAQCRVAVAPLRYGAGMKGKILSYLLAGLPTVSTSIGIEGFSLTPGEDILVENDPYAFAGALIRVYTDEEVWTHLSQKGVECSRRKFSFDSFRSSVHRLVSDVGTERLSNDGSNPM